MGFQVFTVHSELPCKASLSISVDGNTPAPGQKFDHCGSSRALSLGASVGLGQFCWVAPPLGAVGKESRDGAERREFMAKMRQA